jgi:hypothetical protein
MPSICVPFAFHSRSIRFPFAFHSRSIRVPFAFHSRSIRVPIAFHLRSTVTGTHLQNAFRLHSYRNRTSSEIIAISRVLVSLTFTFCVHTIKHQTSFLYLLSTNESRIKTTYDVHITYMYVRGPILRDKTKHNLANFLYSPSSF